MCVKEQGFCSFIAKRGQMDDWQRLICKLGNPFGDFVA